ncbi:MAG: 50S ribosomal protein L9 [Bacteroidota bacterium]|jgi:large subunit ribosomal protein L9
MEVILIQDIANLGFADDIVNVKNGYARNYLYPKGMAKLATESNRKILAENLKQKAFKVERILNEAQAISSKIEGITLRIGTKASEKGKIFGSVTTIQVAEAIKEQTNLEIDRKKISIDGDAIKEIGTYTGKVHFHKEVKTTFNIEVFAE